MLITHKLDWDKCLSHQIWPAIEKGWKDNDKNVHFFWGLAGKNIEKIKDCIKKGEEWWYVDVGYLTDQITRYPIPKINNYDKTYFRIVKGQLHVTAGKVGNGDRQRKLISQGIDAEFKGWYTGETDHVLICPSSETVTRHLHGMSQKEWVDAVTVELKKHTNKEIRFRNKPRPGNEWWKTDIKEDLKGCGCLITNLSLSAIDAILNKVPVICDGRNVAWAVASRDPKYVNKPFKAGKKTVNEWLKFITEHQFTLEEIENGTAHTILTGVQDVRKQTD